MVTAAFADPMTGDPDVLAAAPFPKTWCPYVADTRGRHGLDAYRRRSNVDVDDHTGERERRRGHGTCGYAETQQQRLTRFTHTYSFIFANGARYRTELTALERDRLIVR
jgi:hypothetical protein